MIYKNERDIKLIVLDTKAESMYVRITNEIDLIEVIKGNLNSEDFALVKKGAEINVIELNIINNNNSESISYYDKIYYIYYKIIQKKTKI